MVIGVHPVGRLRLKIGSFQRLATHFIEPTVLNFVRIRHVASFKKEGARSWWHPLQEEEWERHFGRKNLSVTTEFLLRFRKQRKHWDEVFGLELFHQGQKLAGAHNLGGLESLGKVRKVSSDEVVGITDEGIFQKFVIVRIVRHG